MINLPTKAEMLLIYSQHLHIHNNQIYHFFCYVNKYLKTIWWKFWTNAKAVKTWKLFNDVPEPEMWVMCSCVSLYLYCKYIIIKKKKWFEDNQLTASQAEKQALNTKHRYIYTYLNHCQAAPVGCQGQRWLR